MASRNFASRPPYKALSGRVMVFGCISRLFSNCQLVRGGRGRISCSTPPLFSGHTASPFPNSFELDHCSAFGAVSFCVGRRT